jgi:hypothetical protein
VGEAIFIPFFLLSVGMLMDVRVLAGDLRAWEVMIAMTVTVVVAKWMAAWLSGRVFGYSQSEWWTMFGLSVPQAAATLAAALIGVEVGLLDDAVLNGTIMMILVTCILGPWVVDRYGRRLALEEERRPPEAGAAAQRILVPMANPATAPVLMDLALAFREPDSREAIYPITVVPEQEEGSLINVALAERMLSHAVTHAAAVDVPVTPVTRVDDNFANGIRRAALETRTSMIIIGWDGRRSARQAIFGTVLDHLLEVTRQHVIVAKVGHPLNTTSRVILIVPRGSDRISGFFEALRALKRMTSRLGAELRVYLVGAAGRPRCAPQRAPWGGRLAPGARPVPLGARYPRPRELSRALPLRDRPLADRGCGHAPAGRVLARAHPGRPAAVTLPAGALQHPEGRLP